MSELVTIICTVKNGEFSLSKTLESVIQQTYTNWEFVIIDDGSTDRTKEILENHMLTEERIKVYYSGGMGRGKALNKAIELAKGEYIANIDADDLMHPQKIEHQIQIMRNNKSIFLLSTTSKLIYEDEIPVWNNIKTDSQQLIQFDKSLLFRNKIIHSSVIMRKDFLIELGGYSNERKGQIDYELWLRAFIEGKKMFGISTDYTAKRIHRKQSYENKGRVKYTINSSLLQFKFILKEKRNLHFLPLPFISLIISQMPFKFRKFISNKILKEV